MNGSQFLTQIHYGINDAFLSQDPELFDVVFEVEGKKLYAEKIRLSVASPTFKSMLSSQWHRNKNEPIQISGYKFDDFKNFIAFIYSGYCIFNRSNIFAMVDLAEFYQVDYLKQLCDENMSRISLRVKNIFKFIEISKKYSLSRTIEALKGFVEENFEDIIEADEFLTISKLNSEFVSLLEEQEDVFQAIYEWSQHQAKKKQESSEKYLDLNELIKAEISEFLSYFDLNTMKRKFLMQYVLDRSFVFESDEAIEFWNNFKTEVKVKVTNLNGQSLSCILSCDNNMPEIEIIKALKNCPSDNDRENYIYWWWVRYQMTSLPSLTKKDGIEWYLTYVAGGDIGVKHVSYIDDSDFLLAEMMDDSDAKDFVGTPQCKIDIID